MLVVDDGSTDDTPGALAAYGDRIRVVRQENAGRSGARNRAVEEARGELLSFLDSDDRWLPDKLERQVPVLESDEGVAMVHGHVDVIGADGEVLADETARHHELFSAAHRNGVTYAGYAFDCRCFCSALTARVAAVRRRRRSTTRRSCSTTTTSTSGSRSTARSSSSRARPMALYRHHEGQMTTYELTMGQIQTAEKHLRLLDERRDVPDARPRAAKLPAHARARRGRCSATSRASRRHLLRALRLDPGLLRRPWVPRRLVASLVKR